MATVPTNKIYLLMTPDMEVITGFDDKHNISNEREESLDGLLIENPILGVPIAAVLCLLSLLTFIGNAVVLHAIRTERRLQTVSNMFILSLAIADSTVGLVVMPISSAYVLMGKWRFGLAVCQFWLSADYSASTASILNLLVLSLDRYWSISRPLEYLRRRSKKKALIGIIIVWICSLLWIVPIIWWHKFFGDNVRKHPPDVCETEFADNVVFKLTTSILNFYCPMVAMIVTYVRIFLQIRKRARSEVMGRCNDIRPDSFSQNSEPQPLRYALATQSRKSKRRTTKRKKKKEEEDALPHVSGAELDGGVVRESNECENSTGDSYEVVGANSERKWRCNVCGATQDQSDDWSSWPCSKNEENNMPEKSKSEEDISSKKKVEKSSKRKRKSHIFHRERTLTENKRTQSCSTRNSSGMHLRVPQQSEVPAPNRSSSFRMLCSATRGVLRRPSSRRSVVSLRQETKAARQLGVIIGAFMFCWLPYMILFVVTAACESCLNPGVHTAAIWLGYLNSTINPMIYALCNAGFKRAFCKIAAGMSAGWKRKFHRRDTNHISENNPFA